MRTNPFLCSRFDASASEKLLIEGKWYWFDETFDIIGPYDTQDQAGDCLLRYCDTELKGREGCSTVDSQAL